MAAFRNKSDTSVASDFLFVYGTLRKAVSTPLNLLYLKHCRFMGNGHILGKLFEIAGYPGALESGNPNCKVYGEIYRITAINRFWRRLDDYEECSPSFRQPHEYKRVNLPVFLPDGNTLSAWVYLYNSESRGHALIKSGDYQNRFFNFSNSNRYD